VPEIVLERRAPKVAKAHRAQDRGLVTLLDATGDSAFLLALAAAIFVPAEIKNSIRSRVRRSAQFAFASLGWDLGSTTPRTTSLQAPLPTDMGGLVLPYSTKEVAK